MKSGRITRYLLKELLGPTILGLTLYTFVLLMNHFFLVAEKALTRNLGAGLTAKLFMVGIPKLLIMSIPMAVLLGTLIALGRISADREWIALQAAGRSPMVLLRPVLIHGFLGALITFGIYAFVIPETHYAVRSLRGEIFFADNIASDLQERVFRDDLPDDSVLYVDEITSGPGHPLHNVILIQPDPDPGNDSTQLVLAKHGNVYPASDGSGALIVDLYDGAVHLYRSDQPEQYHFATFESYEGRRIDPPRFVAALLNPPNKLAQDLSLAELWQDIGESAEELVAEEAKLAADPAAPRGRFVLAQRRLATAKVELHQRVALPMASFFFALLALPMGLRGVRSGKGAGFAMSVVVILVYRIVFVLARNQAVAGRLPAEVGPWVANAVILVWALILFWRLRRGTTPTRRGGIAMLPVLIWRGIRSIFGRRRASVPAEAGANGEPATDLVALGGTSRRFVGRLDRYVGMAYLRTLGFALASAYMIYALVELQELMDSILRTDQPLILILSYFKYFAPGVLHVVLPIACLVGAIVALTVLARSSELVAVKASGVSMRRVTVPVLLLTVVLCGLQFVVQDRIAPASNRRAQEIKDQIMKRAPRTHRVTATGAWTFGAERNTLYHYRLYDPGEEEFRDLSVFHLDRPGWRIEDHRYVERARWKGETWELDGGWSRGMPEEAEEPRISPLELMPGTDLVQLDLPRHIVREKRRLRTGSDESDDKSLRELREQINTLRNSGYDITKLLVAYHGKFSHAASPLVMVLLGLPFAFRVGRRGSLYGIGVALLLVLVYWATFAVFNALGLETLLRPYVAAWAPNVLFGLLGIYLLLYVKT